MPRPTQLLFLMLTSLFAAKLGRGARLIATDHSVSGNILHGHGSVGFPNDAPEPKWYPQFTLSFNETTKILFTRHTEGTWYYDSVAKKEAVYREDGNGDRYCGSIHALMHTPCTHIVTEGNRYLLFPELGECCLCCTADKGCGILSPRWLEGASFQGTVEMQGVHAYKWRQDGLQPNYWYATADAAQVPLQLDQQPNDRMTLRRESFAAGPPPPAVFALPDGCKDRCPLTSVCTVAASAGEQTAPSEVV